MEKKIIKKKNFLTGEMIWNFADFMTAQCKFVFLNPKNDFFVVACQTDDKNAP